MVDYRRDYSEDDLLKFAYGLKLDQLRAWRVSRDVVDELTLRVV